jgi:hypothetical protein
MMDEEHGSLLMQVRELLGRVLQQVDFPGQDELVRQVQSLDVVGGPVTMLDLSVSEQTLASPFPDGPAPFSAMVVDSAGTAIGELLVWVKDGRLSSLEYAWWTDSQPERLPSIDQVRVTRK